MGAPLLEQRAGDPPLSSSAVREGEVWRFSHGGSTCVVRDGKGIRDVVTLLERPDVDVHVSERAARARVELDFLLDELRRATGLGGRDRTAGDDHERARQAVRARIRHAIGRIGEHHPALGRHLERSIRTGTFCCYAPAAPVAWSISR